MIFGKQIASMSNVQVRFYLICMAMIFMGCQQSNNVGRDIIFNNNWTTVESQNQTNNKIVIRKEFNIDKSDEKLYFIELSSNANIKLQLNNNSIPGIKTNKHLLYNISEDLRKHNIIEIQSFGNIHVKNGKPDLEIRMLCVNKLFIPEINAGISNAVTQSKTLQVEVRIKNAFETEKQGVLVYHLYTDEKYEQLVRETPVFISGNAENIYRQELNLGNEVFEGQEIKIECQLYSNDILFDSNHKVLAINNESLLSKN